MLVEIFSLYLQGLLLASGLVVLVLAAWLGLRRLTKKDRTKEEKRHFLFDVLIIGFISIPILSFAFMALLIMAKA